MATNRHHLNPRGAARAAAALGLLAAPPRHAGLGDRSVRGPDRRPRRATSRPCSGRRSRTRSRRPSGTRATGRATVARLRLWSTARDATVQVFRIGPEQARTVGNKELRGVPVTAPRRVGSLRSRPRRPDPHRRLAERPLLRAAARRRPEGRLRAVRRARRGGSASTGSPSSCRRAPGRPTTSETTTATARRTPGTPTRGASSRARLGRPFLNRGVPPHFRNYDLPFLRWLHRPGKRVDVLAQEDLDETTGAALARAYDLLVFPGHHEYVTTREYDAVEGFRDRGGNLLFLSANNFYWRIELHGRVMRRTAHWRELGRPEAALLGVQYIGYDEGTRRGPWLVRPAAARSWIFAGIRLRHGREFSNAGIEIDATAPSSPPGTKVLAEIPNLFGPGMTAQMTYYETEARREGLLRGRVHARGLDAAAGRAAARGEPLGAAGIRAGARVVPAEAVPARSSSRRTRSTRAGRRRTRSCGPRSRPRSRRRATHRARPRGWSSSTARVGSPCRSSAAAPSAPDPRQQRVARCPGDASSPHRVLARAPRRFRADRRLASGLYFARLRAGRRPRRLRTVRRPARALGEHRVAVVLPTLHVAGLQPARRRRRRARRHVVRALGVPARRGSAARSSNRGVPLQLPPLRPALPALARLDAGARSTTSPTATSRPRRARGRSRGRTT